MGSSFVLFDVSMEITLGQFRSGKKCLCPWVNAIYPWVKRTSVTTAILTFDSQLLTASSPAPEGVRFFGPCFLAGEQNYCIHSN